MALGPSSILLASYWTILVAELIGDKAVYTVTSLATRYQPVNVYTGISAAFMGKMLVAVLFGQALLQLPVKVTAAASAITFFVTAVLLWRKRSAPSFPEKQWAGSWSGGFGISFAAIFFSEWADVGQISTAVLVAQYRMPLAIWTGATAALMTKGLLALTLGMQLRRRVPTRMLKMFAAASCGILGVVALAGFFAR